MVASTNQLMLALQGLSKEEQSQKIRSRLAAHLNRIDRSHRREGEDLLTTIWYLRHLLDLRNEYDAGPSPFDLLTHYREGMQRLITDLNTIG